MFCNLFRRLFMFNPFSESSRNLSLNLTFRYSYISAPSSEEFIFRATSGEGTGMSVLTSIWNKRIGTRRQTQKRILHLLKAVFTIKSIPVFSQYGKLPSFYLLNRFVWTMRKILPKSYIDLFLVFYGNVMNDIKPTWEFY